jgi:hypothetical protein
MENAPNKIEGKQNKKTPYTFGETMPNKTPAIISVILTILLLIIFGILFTLFEMLALNGASDRQGFTAMGISFGCQGAGMILIGISVSWLTNRLISKFGWNQIIAVVVTVFLGTLLGAGISFFSVIIAILLVGTR